jgi:mannose-6-phosphate isomerase-like protein (cupin superfamily)
MQEKIKEIAARIRDLREVSQISAADMAKHLGLPLSAYQGYEDGTDDIPASLLCEVASRLQVDLGILLTGETPHMHVFTVTRSGKGAEVERRRQYRYQSLAANLVHKKAEPFLVTVDPRPAGTPVETNSHPGQEFDFVLEGSLRVAIHDNEIVLNAGDSLFFDSNYPHGMQALGGRPCRFLAIIL